MRAPELLAPAGNLEKLKAAINFGADAVYLGGSKLNLRAFADNFSNEELAEGLKHSKLADQLLSEHNVGANTISSPINENSNVVRGEDTH